MAKSSNKRTRLSPAQLVQPGMGQKEVVVDGGASTVNLPEEYDHFPTDMLYLGGIAVVAVVVLVILMLVL